MEQDNFNTFRHYFEQCYEVLLDMFLKRKYINNIDDIKEDFYNFGISKYDNQITFSNYNLTIAKQQVSIKQKKGNNNLISKNENETDVIILIPERSPQKLESVKKNEIYMGDWFYNPLENERQSKYTILYKKNINYNEDIKTSLLDYYDIKETNLPKIDLYDKVSRFFDCNDGDILKIERFTPRNGIQIYYRIVRKLN